MSYRPPTVREVFASRSLYGLHGLQFIPRALPDSGPLAVTMCVRYMGAEAHEAQVGDSLGTAPPGGIPASEIMRYVSGRGIRCTGWRHTPFRFILERIKQQRPTLLAWPGHKGPWIIPCGYEPDMQVLVFADPERGGFYTDTLANAEATWEGQIENRTQTRVALTFDRVSETTVGHKAPLNRRTFKIQSFVHTTRERNRAAAIPNQDD